MANRNTNNIQIDTGSEFEKLIKLVVIVTLIVLFCYIITIFVNKKMEPSKEPAAQIQYKEILVGNILNQNEKDYYVIVNDKEDNNTVLYNAYIEDYKKNESHLKCYEAELRNPLNNKFYSEKSTLPQEDLKDLKLSGATLLKISNGKIVESYEKENIIKYFKENIKED